MDMAGSASARAVRRIADVRRPARGASSQKMPAPWPTRCGRTAYQAIDNFYTATVYEKGAEVVRMMNTLVGPRRLRRPA